MSGDINTYFRPTSEAAILLKEMIASLFIIPKYETVKLLWRHIAILLNFKFVSEETKSSLKQITKILDEHTLSEKILENFDETVETIDDNDGYGSDEMRRLFDKTLYQQSPFYCDFRQIIETLEQESNETGPFVALNFFRSFLKNI